MAMIHDDVTRMHADEVEIDVSLVRRLVATQFPQWAGLALERVVSAGTVNALFRLGPDMVVRIPRVPRWTSGVEKELRWLPVLAQHLPLRIPTPLATGEPTDELPWKWSVMQWLPGTTWQRDLVADPCAAADDLAAFVTALRTVDATDAPESAPGDRGSPLTERDEDVRAAIEQLGDRVDRAAVIKVWRASLDASPSTAPRTWFHGDLLPGNLLIEGGRLSAVIDFEAAGAGDPSCDLMPAWMVFSGESRDRYRRALSVDDSDWLRGRGWALSVALIALPYYWNTNPVFVELARHAIHEVVSDYKDT